MGINLLGLWDSIHERDCLEIYAKYKKEIDHRTIGFTHTYIVVHYLISDNGIQFKIDFSRDILKKAKRCDGSKWDSLKHFMSPTFFFLFIIVPLLRSCQTLIKGLHVLSVTCSKYIR